MPASNLNKSNSAHLPSETFLNIYKQESHTKEVSKKQLISRCFTVREHMVHSYIQYKNGT